MSGFHSFLRMNNIPLYVYTTFSYLFIHQWTFRLFAPYLAIVNNTAVNGGVNICLSPCSYFFMNVLNGIKNGESFPEGYRFTAQFHQGNHYLWQVQPFKVYFLNNT